jgi:hypothetical protein
MNFKTCLLSISLILFTFISYSQTPRDLVVELKATVQSNPNKIILQWPFNDLTTQYTVFRKLKSETSWGNIKATLDGSVTQYIDSTIVRGVSYEFQVQRITSTIRGYGYINSGIEVPEQAYRGKMILLIDSLFSEKLSKEIAFTIADFEGDGWKVIKKIISRNEEVKSVRDKILAEYNNDKANVKAVYMIGHIPVPYSGNINPDGHPDHLGAWPADVYYAEMTSNWTDVSINSEVASSNRNVNVPGDNKWDQSTLPSDVELQIGRVDFANMPAFSLSEEQLLKNYLQKSHDYKNKVFAPEYRAVIDDNFGYFSGEAFSQSGWRNFGPLVGSENAMAGDYFTTLGQKSHLWSYGCGGGSYSSAGGIGTTNNFATSDLQSVFTMLFGSYFGDWDSSNNFLRAPLAQGKTLTNVWAGRPNWVFHHMGMGENIGYDVRISQNNSGFYYAGYGARFVHLALMGDPSLRNDVVAPVENVLAVFDGTKANISWSASKDDVLGYHVYMKNDTLNDYIRLNSTLITDTFYINSCLLYKGVYSYMVRAVKLQTSFSGSYFNLSIGKSDSTWNNQNLKVDAKFTFTIQNNVITFNNTSQNATDYKWVFSDGRESTDKNLSLSFANGTHKVSLIASNLCDQDTIILLIPITTSVSELEGVKLELFPNPTSEKLSFQFSDNTFEPISIKIYNALGKIVLIKGINNSDGTLDVSTLSKGIYNVTFINKQKQTIRRSFIVL